MTAAVGKVASSAVGKTGGSAFQGAASMGVQRPPSGHFDAPKKAAPKKAAPKKATAPAEKATAPAEKATAPAAESTPPPEDSGGLKIGPPKMPSPQMPGAVNTGAGFVLGLLFWTWVALPFINNGGVTGVKNQLRAKFLNKAPDGSWLP